MAEDEVTATGAESLEEESLPISRVLAELPPGTQYPVSDLAVGSGGDWQLNTPDLTLYCSSEVCNGFRKFVGRAPKGAARSIEVEEHFVTYICRNCRQTTKSFALALKRDNPSHSFSPSTSGMLLKVGEFPPFGPHTPARLIALIGPDRDLFLKGRRAESQGLGIGAFAYYRRIVEEQKGRLIDEIIRVARRVSAPATVLEALEKAKAETQFSRAVEAVKDAVPESLLVEGHNPLVLLHSALSGGLHAEADEDCLELATTIRLVLADLAERVTLTLQEQAELHAAVGKLLNKKSKKPSPP